MPPPQTSSAPPKPAETAPEPSIPTATSVAEKHKSYSYTERTTPSEPSYDDLVSEATAAYQASGPGAGDYILQRAIKLDPSKATAYELLGKEQLEMHYYTAAERNMRSSIERGGRAIFPVRHDHDGYFRDYCEGYLYLSKSGVSYESRNGKHGFEASAKNIKEIKLNGWVGSEIGAFHVKIARPEQKPEAYNFAALLDKNYMHLSKQASELVIALTKAYL